MLRLEIVALDSGLVVRGMWGVRVQRHLLASFAAK